MTPNEEKKLRGILDAIRFDGKSTNNAYSEIRQLFDREELRIKNQREETRFFYVTSLVVILSVAFIVGSCYRSV